LVSHTNDRQREFWLKKKAIGDQWFCEGCGKEVYYNIEPKAIVDHIDNDESHNLSINIQILCRSCNRIKNPSKTFEPAKVLTQSESTNLRVEDAWRIWVSDKVLNSNGEGYPVEDAINAGAELFDCSPETIERRYMKKITSSAGKFEEEKGRLYYKTKQRFEEKFLDRVEHSLTHTIEKSPIKSS